MPAAHCVVCFTDVDGIADIAHVQAEPLYEGVALAVAEFRQDALSPWPTPVTEFTVAIGRPPIEHSIKLCQVEKWAKNTTTEGPAGISKRRRIRSLVPRQNSAQSQNRRLVRQPSRCAFR